MPITLPCPGCSAKLKAPDAAAGRTLTCPGCKTPVLIPGEPPDPNLPPLPRPAANTAVQSPANKPTTATKPPAPPKEEKQEKDYFTDYARQPPSGQPKDEDVYTDFEVVGEDPDVLDEVVPVEEGVEALEEVPDEGELDSLEEVGAPRRRVDDFRWSRILRLGVIHVRGHQGSFVDGFTKEDHRGYDLCDPHERLILGEAREVRDTQTQVLRHFVDRELLTAHLEIREGRYGDLLAEVRRPAYLMTGSTLEITDADNRVLGQFQRSPWKALTQQPMWITSERGQKLLKIQPEFSRWRLAFQTVDGEEVGEMISEGAYEGGGMRLHWFARGMSYYLRFRPLMDNRPEDKLLFLAVTLGMEL
jgi:hypothetical protein